MGDGIDIMVLPQPSELCEGVDQYLTVKHIGSPSSRTIVNDGENDIICLFWG